MRPAPARLPGTWNLVPESSPGRDPGLAGQGGHSRSPLIHIHVCKEWIGILPVSLSIS